MIETPVAVLTVLVAVTAFFFYLEQRTEWKAFTNEITNQQTFSLSLSVRGLRSRRLM